MIISAASLAFLTSLKKYWKVAAIGIAVIVIGIAISKYSDSLIKQGELTEQNEQLEGVVEDVQTSQEAERHILDGNSLGKYCQCLRSTANSENCTRYLPDAYTNRADFPRPRCEQR